MHTTTATDQELPLTTSDGGLRPTFGFLAIHRALRRDAARFVAAAPTVLDDREPLAAMDAHWQGYRALLEFHHAFEDAHLLPMVRARAPELSGLIDELAREHHELDELLPHLSGILASGDPDPAGAESGFVRLRDLLVPHLAGEVEHLVPRLEQGFAGAGRGGPGDDQDGPAQEPPVDASFWLPWVGEQLDDGLVEASLAMQPEEHRRAYPGWLEEYRARLDAWVV